MNKKYAILGLVGALFLLYSFSANPPIAHTGAPGEGLCSDCHTPGTGDGMINVTGFPTTITPNTQYVLTMTSTMTVEGNPGMMVERAGFQLTILNPSNTQAGTLSGASAGSTLQSFNNRQYWEHNPSQVYPSNNMVTWTATWTSPSGPPNTTLTMYAVGNIANGNGTTTGDRIRTQQLTGTLMGGGPELSVTINVNNHVLCNGQSNGSATAVPEGGSMPYSYMWSNGSTSATVNNLNAGTHTVTVTDNFASTATANVVISQPAMLVLNTPNITHVSCNGEDDGSITASASGGVGPYFFSWSNGSNGTTISNLTAGSYTVTVTDDNNCTRTATYTVNQPAALTINLGNLSHETCQGQEDGSITITVSGGATPYFAEWSNGTIGLTNSGLEPGNYSVTVTDENDCTKSASYTINPGGNVEVALVSLMDVSCNGGNDGAITVLASGGLAPYTYLWSNGSTGASISGLTAGNYLVTVSDDNNCEVVEAYTVNQPAPIVVTIGQTGVNTCFGQNNVTLTASATGGDDPYTGLWSNGVVGLVNSNLGAGTYTITITDESGCTNTASSVVTQPTQIVVNVATTDETSSGANDGTATANVSGGTPGYSYLWSTGATTQTITGLAPGIYTVTITDTQTCTATGSGQVNSFGCALTVSLGLDIQFCSGDASQLTPSVSGETGIVTYLWSTGDTTSSIQITAGGDYCVTINDDAGCAASDCLTATEIILPDLNCPVTNESAPGANDGQIICFDDPVFIAWSWSNGATTSTITNLGPGEYCCTVTDINGCTKTQCFTVQSAGCNISVVPTIDNVDCFQENSGSILLTVNGATQPVTFLWSNGGTSALNNNLVAGNYTVTIVDGAGCVLTENYTVTEPSSLTITVDSTAAVQDFDSGLIHITVSGGISPYTYLWTDPLGTNYTDEDINNLSVAGFYSILVTDANGCTLLRDSILVEMSIAVDREPEFTSIKVYPVPANDILIIDHEKQMIEAVITGLDGREYRRITNPSNNKLDVGALESGWYILRMTDGEHWYTARLVK